MSVRLKFEKDGSIEAIADSVEELIAYHQRFAAQNGSANLTRRSEPPKNSPLSESDDSLPEAALRLVKHLYQAQGEVKTSDLQHAFGLSEPRAIGGTVTSLTSWGRRHNLSKKQILIKGRRANGNGHTVRTMALTESFRKMIREGKVPGVTLDT
jgi:hypothetical protein